MSRAQLSDLSFPLNETVPWSRCLGGSPLPVVVGESLPHIHEDPLPPSSETSILFIEESGFVFLFLGSRFSSPSCPFTLARRVSLITLLCTYRFTKLHAIKFRPSPPTLGRSLGVGCVGSSPFAQFHFETRSLIFYGCS